MLIMACAWLLIGTSISAQSGKLPPFQMVQSNGHVFRASDLPFGKPILIVYFSPECEDCHNFLKELLNHTNELGRTSIVMISFLSVEAISQTINSYKLNEYPNIYVGTEGTSFFVRNYYRIEHIPFLALHNKNGDLVKTYRQDIDINTLLNNIKNLK